MLCKHRLLAATLLFLAGAAVPVTPVAAQEQNEWLFGAVLTGSAEVPGPGDSGGLGVSSVVFTRNEDGSYQACFTLAVSGLSAPAVAAHIHPGAAGVAGPVVVPFQAPTPISSGCTAVEQGLGDQIVANSRDYYVNVHTSQFPAGAVRGQLFAVTLGMDGTGDMMMDGGDGMGRGAM